MALSIKNPEVERLAAQVSKATGESKTEAVRKVLEQRLARLSSGVKVGKRQRWVEFLESEVWPDIPQEQLGRRLSKEEVESILGFGLTAHDPGLQCHPGDPVPRI